MTKQPNCPYCKSEKFAIVSHSLQKVKNQKTKEDCDLVINLLCCDSCMAVICQFDRTKAELKPI